MSANGTIRVLVVEDNDVFREALELLLGLQSDIEVVASVSDGTQAVPACQEHRPDVVVMDYRLPGIDGVEATKAVLESCPGTAVVVDALQDAGAVACLTKDQDLDEIVEAIHRAAGGRWT